MTKSGYAATLRRRIGDVAHGDRRVVVIAMSVVWTTGLTSVLGLAFWALVARKYAVDVVGEAAGAVGAMTLIATISMLGLGTLLIDRWGRLEASRRHSLVRGSLMVSGAAGALGALIVGPILALTSSTLRDLSSPVTLTLLAVATGLSAAAFVLDQALLTRGGGGLQVERNVVASIVKLVAVVIAVLVMPPTINAVLLAWLIGLAASMVYVAGRLRGAVGRPAWQDVREVVILRRAASGHHVLNLTLQAPFLLLPVVTAIVLTSDENAFMATARMVSGLVFTVPFALTVGLFVVAQGHVEDLLARMRRSIPLGLSVACAAVVFLVVFGGPILALFGAQYRDESYLPLIIMSLAAIPLVLKDHYVALRRVQSRLLSAARLVGLGTVLEVVAAAVGGARGGAIGLSIAWALAVLIEGILMGGPVCREVWFRGTQGTDED
jgi:O-antigen/teichoic acid export membrane protein